MKRALLLLTVFAACSMIRPSKAHADSDLGLFALGALAEAVAVVGFTAGDIVIRDHSLAYGVAETAVNAPVAAAMTYYAFRYTSSDRWINAGVAVVNGALVAHGVYTIVRSLRDDRAEPTRPAMIKVGSVRASLAPAIVGDSVAVGTGMAIGGTF